MSKKSNKLWIVKESKEYKRFKHICDLTGLKVPITYEEFKEVLKSKPKEDKISNLNK